MLSRIAFTYTNKLPVILQTEVAECGLACLAMISAFHGNRTDLGILRRRYAGSIKGMTIKNVMQIASRLSMTPRAVRIDIDEIQNLRLPCVLHWNFSHFVVLERVTNKGIVIHDPAHGRRVVGYSEASKHFTGVALEVWPTGEFEQRTEKERVRLSSLFANATGLRRALVQLFVLSLCLEIFALLSPIGSQIVIDQVIVSADLDLLTTVVIALCMVLVLQTAIGVARSWIALVMGTGLGLHWTVNLFEHLLKLPLSYFEKRHIGDVVSRFSSLAPIQKALTTDIINAILDVLMVIGAFNIMLIYGGWLTWVAIASIVIQSLIRMASYQLYRSANEEALVMGAKEDSHFLESVRGIASLKSLNLLEKRQSVWLNLMVDSVNSGVRIAKLDLIFGTSSGLLLGFDRIIMLWLGARAVIDGTMTIGMLIAFLAYKDQLSSRLSALIGLAVSLKMLSLHSERIADIALSEPENVDHAKTLPSSDITGAIDVEQISFRYSENDPEIISNVSLSIPSGAYVAITGPSGEGKTTLLKIMAGLLPASGGQIRIDGFPLETIGLAAYRDVSTCVLQDDRLFAGTIGENIASFDEAIHPDQIQEYATLAAVHDEISAMPMGYETLVGDMGSSLSGGQKQRIILARALARKPKILFLDEATSHLDEDNEQKINAALAALSITRVIVAHRPSSFRHADKVYVLSEKELKLLSLNMGE